MSELTLIRNSELSTYRQCRQKWEWAYLDGLKPLRNRPALAFGSLCHDVMERFYPPGIRRGGKPHELWEQVWAEYLEGGGEDFRAAGDIMASELGYEMMKNYWDEYGKDDQFKIIQPEQAFQIDIHDPETGRYICTFTGQMDAVVENRSTKKRGLFEHKTGASLDPFGAPLIMDEQAGTYWTLGAQYLVAKGLIKGDLDFVLYNRLRKAMKDQRPQDAAGHYLNKNGTVSKQQPPPLFKREYTVRTQEDRQSVFERIIMQAKEMEMVRNGELGVYKNPDKHCGYCEFRDMCEVHEVKSDWQAVRKNTMGRWDPYESHNNDLQEEES